jgi:hypothetical protein
MLNIKMAISKYKAVKTIVDGFKFDSKREAKRYAELELLQKAKQIMRLKLQPTFELVKPFEHEGKKFRALTYRADFCYIEIQKIIKMGLGASSISTSFVIEDAKGFKTEVYKIKRKLLLSMLAASIEGAFNIYNQFCDLIELPADERMMNVWTDNNNIYRYGGMKFVES